jgi:dihydrodipicolinate synthase/N-acetylneuraminate lyase
MSITKKYSGVVVPMITPVNEYHKIDTGAVERLVSHISDNNTHPFILGTTGESASIARSEKQVLVKEAVKAAKGKGTIYAGISGNSVFDSIEEAQRYHDLGAQVFVSTMASYYPVEPDQILRYFILLADAIPGPLVIYNIPGTTHLSIPVEVVDLLSQHPNIVGFKDSERSTERLESCLSLWKERADFSYLTGWAAQSFQAMKLGADGLVPSTANLAPELYHAIYRSVLSGDDSTAAAAQEKADRVSEIYQKDRTLNRSLPALKAMMSAYGLCQPCMLPPLYQFTEVEEKGIQNLTRTKFGDLNEINSIDHD